MYQIELVFYRSSYPTPKSAHTISSEFKDSVRLKIQWNGESNKCFLISKITIKREFIPHPKHIISIINVYAPTSQFVRDYFFVLVNLYNDVSTVCHELKNKSLVFVTG